MIFADNDIVTYISGISAAIIGGAFGLQKAMKMWSSDRKDISKNSIETDLFQRLSDETRRLHEQNAALASTVEHLRLELGKLHEEITSLRIENATLRQEVTLLHEELGDFRASGHFDTTNR